MHFTQAITAAILAFAATGVLAIPVPQLAGEGAAANSILSGTDNAVGYGVEDAEDNIANSISKVTGNSAGSTSAGGTKRQLAGEGAAADSILTDTDNGVGYGIENAEDNTADTISKVTGNSAGTTSGGGSNPPPPPPHKRQLDKIAKGEQAISNAAGTGQETQAVTDAEVNADGTLTSGAANAGAEIGSTEESTLENAGSSVPKTRRQLDKIAKGEQAISNAAGTGQETQAVTDAEVNADGTLTSGAANAGAEVGSTEESTLESIGSSVPRRFRA